MLRRRIILDPTGAAGAGGAPARARALKSDQFGVQAAELGNLHQILAVYQLRVVFEHEEVRPILIDMDRHYPVSGAEGILQLRQATGIQGLVHMQCDICQIDVHDFLSLWWKASVVALVLRLFYG
jgi:hypothetical protein